MDFLCRDFLREVYLPAADFREKLSFGGLSGYGHKKTLPRKR